MTTEPTEPTEVSDDMTESEQEAQFEQEQFIATTDLVRAKIMFALGIYPYLSEPMIQVSIGPGIPPIIWRPVFNKLVEEGTLLRETLKINAPSGYPTTQKIYHLNTFPYPPITLAQQEILQDQAKLETDAE